MKSIKIVLIIGALASFLQTSQAQTINWISLKDTKHQLYAGVGWDYSLAYSIGYAYKPNTKMPMLLISSFSIPAGKNLLDDFKTKLGTQILVLDKHSLKGSLVVNGIFRRFENPLLSIHNFGAELKGSVGIFKSKWFVAGESGFDKAIATRLVHSDIYKKEIYTNVKNGWYESATGGNFMYGLQGGVSFKKSDIVLNIGKVITQDFKTSPLVPYYLHLGYNLRIR